MTEKNVVCLTMTATEKKRNIPDRHDCIKYLAGVWQVTVMADIKVLMLERSNITGAWCLQGAKKLVIPTSHHIFFSGGS